MCGPALAIVTGYICGCCILVAEGKEGGSNGGSVCACEFTIIGGILVVATAVVAVVVRVPCVVADDI